MAKIKVVCETCGAEFFRQPSGIGQHTFCSQQCARAFTSARMTEYNKTRNPLNKPDGWTQEMREKKSKSEKLRHEISDNSYSKHLGKHEHRRVAEEILGRPLKKGEVVHHINGDRHDNRPENLMIFASQSEHIKYHAAHPEESGWQVGKKGGDAKCLKQ